MQILGFTDQSNNQAGIDSMLESANTFQVVLLISFIVIMAPIVEELVFRKGIYGIAGKLTKTFLSRKDKGNLSHILPTVNELESSELHYNEMDQVRKKKIHLISSIVQLLLVH